MMKEAEDIIKIGDFPLTKWASSSQIAKKEISKTFAGFTDIECLKVLGISCLTEDDCLSFQTIQTSDHLPFTKRLLLSITARLFDPLGFLPHTQ